MLGEMREENNTYTFVLCLLLLPLSCSRLIFVSFVLFSPQLCCQIVLLDLSCPPVSKAKGGACRGRVRERGGWSDMGMVSFGRGNEQSEGKFSVVIFKKLWKWASVFSNFSNPKNCLLYSNNYIYLYLPWRGLTITIPLLCLKK